MKWMHLRYYLMIGLMLNTLPVISQSRLSFGPAQRDFGTIAEADGPVSYVFKGINTSDRPLVILDVVSSCGCTVPEFSRQPILPGQTAAIKVTYDPANRPGAFSKDLTVYDTERRPVATLTVRGTVMPRERTVEELYPVNAGSGLRLTESLATFSYLHHDRPATSVIGIANASDRPLRLELVPDESSGYLTTDYPHQLPAGSRGEIRLTYHLPDGCGRYGTVKDLLTLRIDGRDSRIPLMAHGIAVDNPHLSNEISVPKAEIDKYILKFGVLKRANGLQKLPLHLTNKGDGQLIVRAVEPDGGIGCTLRTGRRIAPGQSVTAYVTVDPAQQEYGPLSGHLTIVTNDPSRPMRRIRVTAIMEE